jgi:membrane-associated protease RseP (regulator of RpoE activity)
MSGTVGILLFVLVIFVVILVHEAAHFFSAKAFGIKVEEFFLGFGPRLWSFRRGDTEYGVKALPLGGYVRIAGMNPFQEPTPEERPRTFGAKPAWQRAIVIVAGPATHFVMAFLFFAVWLGLVGIPSKFAPVVGRVEASLVGSASPAAEAGLQAGDEVVAVDGIEHPGTDQLVAYTRRHVGEEITLRVERDGREFTVQVTPVLANVEGMRVGRIGVQLVGGEVLARDRSGPVESLTQAGVFVGRTTSVVVESVGRIFGPQGLGRIVDLLFGQAERQPDDVTSIVGGARIAGQAVSAGAADVLLQLFGVFNVFVGILNLLPVPPFDGGHLAVIGWEKIRGRKVDARKLVPLTAVVATFLILYMFSLLYLDIVKPVPNLFR